MMDKRIIEGRDCYIYDGGSLKTLLIQPIGDFNLETMDQEIEQILKLSEGRSFTMVMFVTDWNQDLPPWEADPVMGDEAFGNGAADTLEYITAKLIPNVADETTRKIFLGGYSLAGLFTLWAAFKEDLFDGIAAASPSAWYPGFLEYAKAQKVKTDHLYLSLGTKEEKTRNPVMKTVGDNLRAIYEMLDEDSRCQTILEMNPGNHFRDEELRMAKAFAWLMARDKEV